MRLLWGFGAALGLSIAGCGMATTIGGSDTGPIPGGDAAIVDAAVTPVDVDPPLRDADGLSSDGGHDAGAEPCGVAGTIEHVPCGMCGTLDRFCSAALSWVYGACTGETGVCVPGTTQSAGTCGMCGTQAQFCNTTCTWQSMGACTGETGMCVAGSTTRVATGCPPGQTRIESCSATCMISDGPCEAADCTPGEVGTTTCGRCGTQQRMCDPMGHWMTTGGCTGEGPCAVGATSTQACSVCGTQPITCDATCHFQPSGACVGGAVCGPMPASTCTDAMTLHTYAPAPMCVAGACVYGASDVTCPGGCASGACVGHTTVIGGLGGTTGFGPNTVATGDDSSSTAVALTAAWGAGLHYYDMTYASFFVNNNGNLSFGSAQNAYTPTFPGAMAPMIATFWADVDTGGTVMPMHDTVNWYVDDTRAIATWNHVGYFAQHHDHENTFQVILTRRSDVAAGDFDVELRYEQCEWTTGDASGGTGGLGGTPASAGFDAGDHARSLALPGSGTAMVLNLCTTSNVGMPGTWRYQVRGGIPM